MGEKLKDSEVDQLLRGVEKDNEGNINYEGKQHRYTY
jgi:Ca2+-binding EF-hand superfamily protein